MVTPCSVKTYFWKARSDKCSSLTSADASTSMIFPAQSSTAGYTPVVQPMCRFELSRWLQHNPCARYRTQPGKVSPCDAWESL